MTKIPDAVEYLKERLRYCSRATKVKKEVVEMSIVALEFQKEHQEELTYQDGFDKGFNDGCEITEKEHQAKVQNCIDKLVQEASSGNGLIYTNYAVDVIKELII